MPALLPFVLVVLLSIPFLRIDLHTLQKVVADTMNRLRSPSVILVGALIMVQLMTLGGDKSQTTVIGRTFANMTEAGHSLRPYWGSWPPSFQDRRASRT